MTCPVTRAGARTVIVALAVGAAGCGGDFERMREQPRYELYGASPVFADGKAMQMAPPGTVARALPEARPPLTPALLDIGRRQFAIYCAPCHGDLGDGDSAVAERMPLRKPPSLLEPRIAGRTPDEIYTVISEGFGLMPPYAFQLPATERWAVVAYVRALQRSQLSAFAALPATVQQEAQRALGAQP